MTTCVIPQKGLPKDYLVHIKGDKSITEVVGETPSDPTTLHRSVIFWWRQHLGPILFAGAARPNSKPSASAAADFPVPEAPQKSAVVTTGRATSAEAS